MNSHRRLNEWPVWPNARDWIGIGTFVLTVMILWMLKEDKSLLKDDFFKTIATLIIGTAFVNGPVSWAYAATKGGTELADKNADIIHTQAQRAEGGLNDGDRPAGTEADPVHVEETKP